MIWVGSACILVACAPAPDVEGTVTQINSRSVTIQGQVDASPGAIGQKPTPTPAMVSQAKELCPKAKFVSASYVDKPDGLDLVPMLFADFLFVCE